MEVEATISNVIGLKDATSYGVEIPGTDGNYLLITNKKYKPFDFFLLILNENKIHFIRCL